MGYSLQNFFYLFAKGLFGYGDFIADGLFLVKEALWQDILAP